jgi:hypothetical protein
MTRSLAADVRSVLVLLFTWEAQVSAEKCSVGMTTKWVNKR